MTIIRNYLNLYQSRNIYGILKENVPWNEGVKTRNGSISRMQCHVSECDLKIQEFLNDLMVKTLKLHVKDKTTIVSIYLNYYRDNSDYCPKHRHTDTKQMILSLGCTRKINIDGLDYTINSGDLIFFDDEVHSIPKSKILKEEGRISIAVFYV